jgi:hypothetical protein
MARTPHESPLTMLAIRYMMTVTLIPLTERRQDVDKQSVDEQLRGFFNRAVEFVAEWIEFQGEDGELDPEEAKAVAQRWRDQMRQEGGG